MKAQVVGRVSRTPSGEHEFPITVGKGSDAKVARLTVWPSSTGQTYDPSSPEPFSLNESLANGPDGLWLFRDSVVSVEDSHEMSMAEVILRIKHVVLRSERALARVRREVEAFENMERLPSARREKIPDSVRLFVWQRDEGKCVRCGSAEKLEFDHVIPVTKGGANTERNIQLLCESCNRVKGAAI